MLYVLETDAPCVLCGDEHGYVTTSCNLAVFTDWKTARMVGNKISGAVLRQIEDVPPGISYTLFPHLDGKPNPAYPQKVVTQ